MRKFGVEIEFNARPATGAPMVGMSAVADAIRARGVDVVTGWVSFDVNGAAWNLKEDSSCGYEIVSPALDLDTLAIDVPVICGAIRAMGLKADYRCGLHVHVSGFGNAPLHTLRNVVRRWINFEDTLDLIQPDTRRGDASQYCLSNMLRHGNSSVEANANIWRKVHDVTSYEQIISMFNPGGAVALNGRMRGEDGGTSRYFKVNLVNLLRTGTVEVRHHMGTINPETILAWIGFVDGFVDVAMKQERLWRRPSDTPEPQSVRFKKMMRGIPAPVGKRLRALATANNGGVDPFA
jgi:hypothetical protein